LVPTEPTGSHSLKHPRNLGKNAGREVEVFRLVARGLSNHAIATALSLTEATVKTHLIRLCRKLGAGNRTGAVSEAVRRGLVELDDPA